MPSLRITLLTLLAMVAFASNSLLCRAALRQTTIDPASFTLFRILSGAIALGTIITLRRAPVRDRGNWISALALFIYAAAFSLAYTHIAAGTGALLLFGAVQATMIISGLCRGERLGLAQTVGLAGAIGGLVILLSPGMAAPPLVSALLMASAGCAWGFYSLRGRGAEDPVGATAGNFLRGTLLAVIMSLLLWRTARIDSLGLVYAATSGALTSGLGYVIWYAVLPRLKATTAASIQLSVPVIATIGGISLLHEPVTIRLLIASLAVIGGIALVAIEKPPASRPSS